MDSYIIIIIILILYICKLKNQVKCEPIAKKEMQNLIRQISRWSTASKQDNNPLIATLHANYGASYLFALTDIKSDSEIKVATGVDMKKLRYEVLKIQDEANLRMLKYCPIKVQNEYLARLAGEFV